MTNADEILEATRNWSDTDKRRFMEELARRRDSQKRVWYCDRPPRLVHGAFGELEYEGCDGQPHEHFPYKHARAKQWPPPGSMTWRLWLVMSGRGWGKGFQLNTRIRTVSGWKQIADIEAGDLVFNERGRPVEVLEAHEPYLAEEMYRLTFSDGATLDADAPHQWVTWTHADRKAYNQNVGAPDFPADWVNWRSTSHRDYSRGEWPEMDQAIRLVGEGESIRNASSTAGVSRESLAKRLRGWEEATLSRETGLGPQIRHTRELFATLSHNARGDLNHCIPLAGPLVQRERDLPIHPYLLGYWLGDGMSDGSAFACGSEDWAHLERVLVEMNVDYAERNDACVVKVRGMRSTLRQAGVLMDKHIPEMYLRASVEQRLALLQGLMDSDGCAEASKVEFTTISERLAEQVLELVRSLSERPRLYSGRATLNGRDISAKYRIVWRPSKFVPFRLQRKAERVHQAGSQALRLRHRMITSIERIPSTMVRCLTVSGESSMYLAGEALVPTHNTATGANWIRKVSEKVERTALVGRRGVDIRGTMVEGDSGLIRVCEAAQIGYEWFPSKKEFHFANGHIAYGYCVPHDTEALTPDGWRPRSALMVGDLVRTLDLRTGMSRWSPIEALNDFELDAAPMVALDMHLHSSLSTVNHRWVARDKANGRLKMRDSLLEFSTKDSIVTAVPAHDLPTESPHSAAFAALVGWWTSEGNLTRAPAGRRRFGTIVQKGAENPLTQQIHEVLTELYGPPRSSLRGVREPAWSRSEGKLVTFLLNDEAIRQLLAVTEGDGWDKIVTLHFINDLTTEGLARFARAFIAGDGHWKERSATVWQKNARRLAALEHAAILLGWTVSTHRGNGALAVSPHVGSTCPRTTSKDRVRMEAFTGDVWCPTTRDGTWLAKRNGTVFYTGNSAEEPDSLRGPQHGAGWWDEPAHMPLLSEAWGNYKFGLRLPGLPGGTKTLATSTPLPIDWLDEQLGLDTTFVTRGSTFENESNLDPDSVADMRREFEGTRKGRQELHGEILRDVEGALWNLDMFTYPPIALDGFDRIVVAIDPAGTANRKSDQTGIVVAGKKGDEYWALEDLSGKYSPAEWSDKAITAYHRWGADAVIAEKNYGGDMVSEVIRHAIERSGDDAVRVIVTTATRSKQLRAEPVVGLYEQTRVHHLKGLEFLEKEMTTWVPGKGDSPNRVDALVWAVTDLAKLGGGPAAWRAPTGKIGRNTQPRHSIFGRRAA